MHKKHMSSYTVTKVFDFQRINLLFCQNRVQLPLETDKVSNIIAGEFGIVFEDDFLLPIL